jgi:outer membrane protein assembly factor BamB
VVNLINASNGERLWQSQNAYADYDSNPVCANGKVFVGGRNSGGHVTAFDLSTGTELWNFLFNADICARPLLVNDLIIVTTSTTKVYALKQATGQLVWTKDFSRQSDNFGAEWVSPSLAQGNIIIHTKNKGFYALDPVDGAIKWSYQMAASTVSSPTFGNGKIYFTETVQTGPGGYRSKLIALNAMNGTLVWENLTSFSGLFNPIFAKNNLYLQDDNIYLFNSETGAIIGQVGSPVVTAISYVVRMNNVAYYDCEHGNYKTE